MYVLRFTQAIIQTTYTILSVRKREQNWATKFLKQLEYDMNGPIDPFTFNKIVNRYAIYIPMICDPFTSLRGRVTNQQEKERMLYYFICGSLFDNFCDRKELTPQQLYDISFHANTYTAQRVDERLFIYAHLLLKNQVRFPGPYHKVTEQLYQAQLDSEQQFNPTISPADLQRITFNKGGYSVLLCHFYLDETAGEAEQQCWYHIGSIIQLTNDLFDIYKDLQDASITLPNTMRDAHAFHTFFLEQVQQFKTQINELPFPHQAKQQFALSMMGICSLGLLSINQLIKLQNKAPQLPELNTLPRKALIVDMEKPANLLQCIRLVYHHTKPWFKKQNEKTP